MNVGIWEAINILMVMLMLGIPVAIIIILININNRLKRLEEHFIKTNNPQ